MLMVAKLECLIKLLQEKDFTCKIENTIHMKSYCCGRDDIGVGGGLGFSS